MQVGNADSDGTARLQHPVTFFQKGQGVFPEQVFQEMRGVNKIHGIVGEGYAVSQVMMQEVVPAKQAAVFGFCVIAVGP